MKMDTIIIIIFQFRNNRKVQKHFKPAYIYTYNSNKKRKSADILYQFCAQGYQYDEQTFPFVLDTESETEQSGTFTHLESNNILLSLVRLTKIWPLQFASQIMQNAWVGGWGGGTETERERGGEREQN